jgi:PAS domain S-box-containing protein
MNDRLRSLKAAALIEQHHEAATEEPSCSVARLIYKGRKYYWQAKVNLHIHIIEHLTADVLEIVAYHTKNFQEAEHVYISASYLYNKVDEEAARDKIESVREEFRRMKQNPPEYLVILEWIKKNFIANYILEHLTVTNTENGVVLDVKDSGKDFRISHRLTSLQKYQDEAIRKIHRIHLHQQSSQNPTPSSSRRNSGVNNNDTPEDGIGALPTIQNRKEQERERQPENNSNSKMPHFGERSLILPKPAVVNTSEIKRFGRSTTLIGELVSVAASKEEETLMKLIQAVPPKKNSESRRGSRSNTIWVRPLHNFHKFSEDLKLLQDSLSFIHISDFILLQLVSKNWQQALVNGLKSSSFTCLVLSSRQSYLENHSLYLKEKIWTAMNEFREEQQEKIILQGKTLSNNNSNEKVNSLFASAKTNAKPNQQLTVRSLSTKNANYFEIPEPLKNVYSYKTSDVPLDPIVGNSSSSTRSFIPRKPSIAFPRKSFSPPMLKPGRMSSSALSAAHREEEKQQKYLQTLYHENEKMQRLYVLPETVLSVYKLSCQFLSQLTLHYVVINPEFITGLASLNGRLTKLSLGVIKVDDCQEETVPNPVSFMRRPSNSSAIVYGGLLLPTSNPGSRRNSNAQSAVPSPPMKHYNIPSLRYLNTTDVKQILSLCGSEVTSLELSVTVTGTITPDIFQHTPKLSSFALLHSMISYQCELNSNPILVPPPSSSLSTTTIEPNNNNNNNNNSNHSDGHSLPSLPTQVNLTLQEYRNSLTTITLPELLAYLAEHPSDALMLLDKKGKIIAVNSIFERVFLYSNEKLFNCQHITFLTGKLTNPRVYEKFQDSLQRQIKSEEFSLLLYNSLGYPIYVQLFLLPNITKFVGVPLTSNCLSEEFLMDIAFEQYNYEQMQQKRMMATLLHTPHKLGVGPWKIGHKEFSYHLIRFCVLSQPILPYYNVQDP